jgi:hypothetical protein
MLYRWWLGLPQNLDGILWDAFQKDSLQYTVLMAVVFGLLAILYLRYVYKIDGVDPVYAISKAFWWTALVAVVLHTGLLYWLSYLVFDSNLLNALLSSVMWKVRLWNAIASNLEFLLIFFLAAKLGSLAFAKTRYLLLPR